MPPNLRHYIEVTLGGRDIFLVSQKRLTATDVSPNHRRLVLTNADVGFLNEEEMATLESPNFKDRTIPVQVVDPHQLECPRPDLLSLAFRRWELIKTARKAITVYVLTTSGWTRLVEDNKLSEGDEIQIWSFRVGPRLHMAAVVRESAPRRARPLPGRLIGV